MGILSLKVFESEEAQGRFHVKTNSHKSLKLFDLEKMTLCQKFRGKKYFSIVRHNLIAKAAENFLARVLHLLQQLYSPVK